MLTRIISGLVLLPVAIFVIVTGGAALRAVLALISIIGMSELYKAVNGKHSPENILSYAAVLTYYFFLDRMSTEVLMIIVGLYIVSNLVCLVVMHSKITPLNFMVNVFGFFYIAFLLSGIYFTRSYTQGRYLVWLIFISAWACDTFAYFTGRLIGKRKLASVLSPKKTVEGAIGGTLGAALTAALFAYLLTLFSGMVYETNVILIYALLGGVGAVFAQIGDLTASAIKRHTGIKDYGRIIPGHGGVLDRFDSVICTAPMVYAAVLILL